VEAVVGEAGADAALVAEAIADSTFQCNDKQQLVPDTVKFKVSDLKAAQDIQLSKHFGWAAIFLDRLAKI